MQIRMLVVFLLGLVGDGVADCTIPNYREGHVWEDSPSTIMLNISIPLNEFAPKRLICLAGALKKRYSGHQEITVLLFSSYEGALRFTAPFAGDSPEPRVNWSLDNHAMYSYDAAAHEEYIEILPFGQNRLLETRIDLPSTSRTKCTLQVSGRCLLALSRLEYPLESLRTGTTGTITLEAAIEPDGSVTRVRAVRSGQQPTSVDAHLTQAATENLKTWHFETASRTNSIRIAYVYGIEAKGPPGQARSRFNLPSKVEIIGTPPI